MPPNVKGPKIHKEASNKVVNYQAAECAARPSFRYSSVYSATRLTTRCSSILYMCPNADSQPILLDFHLLHSIKPIVSSTFTFLLSAPVVSEACSIRRWYNYSLIHFNAPDVYPNNVTHTNINAFVYFLAYSSKLDHQSTQLLFEY